MANHLVTMPVSPAPDRRNVSDKPVHCFRTFLIQFFLDFKGEYSNNYFKVFAMSFPSLLRLKVNKAAGHDGIRN